MHNWKEKDRLLSAFSHPRSSCSPLPTFLAQEDIFLGSMRGKEEETDKMDADLPYISGSDLLLCGNTNLYGRCNRCRTHPRLCALQS